MKKIAKFFLMMLMIVVVVSAGMTSSYANNLGYKWPNSVSNIFFYYSTDHFTTAESTAVRNAFNQWNNLQLSYSIPHAKSLFLTASSSAQTESCTVTKVETDWRYGESTIAYADNFASNGQLIYSKILLNDVNHNFSANADSGSYHIQSVVLHEAGHSLGVAHCHELENADFGCDSFTCSANIMNPAGIVRGAVRTTFQNYDIVSYQSLYQ